jgi:hypothetical protein
MTKKIFTEEFWIDFWNGVRDFGHKVKLYIGFKFFGWHKPAGKYQWAYFVDKTTVVRKYRDENRIIHSVMIVWNANDGVVEFE